LSRQPISPEELPGRLADWLAATPGVLRVAVDGPPGAAPEALAESLIEPLHARGRPAVHVRAAQFWRDASVRLEHGRQDVESYLSWLDADTLRREVLDAAVADRTYLPSLRDPVTNRSTHESRRALAANTVVLVSGEFLLGKGLPFDQVLHLELPAAARARRVRPEDAWTLPAFDQYDAAVRPTETADVTIKVDRRVPAVRGLS
jgi:hypothetical protein